MATTSFASSVEPSVELDAVLERAGPLREVGVRLALGGEGGLDVEATDLVAVQRLGHLLAGAERLAVGLVGAVQAALARPLCMNTNCWRSPGVITENSSLPSGDECASCDVGPIRDRRAAMRDRDHRDVLP